MLKTPAGTPASWSNSAIIFAENGAYCDGFKTIVFPVANAGNTLAMTTIAGQFQGVIKPHTPMGDKRTIVEPNDLSKEKSLKISMVICACLMGTAAWASSANFLGAPISSVMA